MPARKTAKSAETPEGNDARARRAEGKTKEVRFTTAVSTASGARRPGEVVTFPAETADALIKAGWAVSTVATKETGKASD